jgi:hypothetical protein
MIVSHLLLILHKKIQFSIFMFEAWNVAKGRKVQGGRILSQGTVTVGSQCQKKLLHFRIGSQLSYFLLLADGMK